MNRFKKTIVPIVTDEQKDLCCYSFSLLLNSLDLESMTNIFRIILVVFLSEYQTEVYTENYNKLVQLINDRPLIVDDVKDILNSNER